MPTLEAIVSIPFADELLLGLCLALNGVVLATMWRLSGRVGAASVGQRASDTFLGWMAIQYAAVGIPGLLHCLNLWSMSATALLICAVLWRVAGRLPDREGPGKRWTLERWAGLGAFLFGAGFMAAYLWNQRWVPPMSTDSLVYQLSTAVQWLHDQTLTIFPTWYWNPANSYAPQCATASIVWWTAPLGCDVFSRFVQAPALLWIFCLCYQLARTLAPGGCRAAAACLALAAVLSRPLFSEVAFAKDDLFVTAFFAASVLSLSRTNLRDRFGAWRVGICFGLLLASKYTVLMVCPIFLFLIDAPARAGWKPKDYFLAMVVAVALSFPWYLRNILSTGNPLFPVDVKIAGVRNFQGLFGTEPDRQLRAVSGIWRMLSTTYHSLPPVLLLALMIFWSLAAAAAGKTLLTDSIRRACAAGSVLVMLLFLVASPHHEVRYLFPLMVLWFAVAAIGLSRWLPSRGAFAVAALLALISVITSFDASLIRGIVGLAITALLISGAGVGLVVLCRKVRGVYRAALGIASCGTLMLIYINWHSYVESYRQGCIDAWSIGYEPEAPAWQFVREQLPTSATVAFANTQFVYPLYGFHYDRNAIYAPVRRGLHHFVNLPRLGQTVPGDLIVEKMTAAMNADPNRSTWMQNLSARNAKYLLVFKHGGNQGLSDDPVELRFAAQFERVFEDANAVIFRLPKRQQNTAENKEHLATGFRID